jgi:uncharacterized protein YuzE
MTGPTVGDLSFKVNISVEESTGRLLAAYFSIRKGKVTDTGEVVDGRLNADYDEAGRLLGVEMLGPCDARMLDQLPVEPEVKAFIRRTAPAELAMY